MTDQIKTDLTELKRNLQSAISSYITAIEKSGMYDEIGAGHTRMDCADMLLTCLTKTSPEQLERILVDLADEVYQFSMCEDEIDERGVHHITGWDADWREKHGFKHQWV